MGECVYTSMRLEEGMMRTILGQCRDKNYEWSHATEKRLNVLSMIDEIVPPCYVELIA